MGVVEGEELAFFEETDATKKDDFGLFKVVSWGLEVLAASQAEK